MVNVTRFFHDFTIVQILYIDFRENLQMLVGFKITVTHLYFEIFEENVNV